MHRVIRATIFAVLALVLVAASATAQPRIVVDEPAVDLGEVFEEPLYGLVFIVKNAGDADLAIAQIRSTCGCTTARFDRVIPPGGQGEIVVEIDGGKVMVGSFVKKAAVLSNDPDNPQVMLSITGTVRSSVDVRPSKRIYLEGGFLEAAAREVVISSRETEHFEILEVTSTLDDKIAYTLLPDGQTLIVALRWENDHLEGPVDVRLVLARVEPEDLD